MTGYADYAGSRLRARAVVVRVVSLVPPLTEAIAFSCPEKLVGATGWCTHPAELDVVRVRSTKNPDIEAIGRHLSDLAVANTEENRTVDIDILRAIRRHGRDRCSVLLRLGKHTTNGRSSP